MVGIITLLVCLLFTVGMAVYMAVLLRGERYESAKFRGLYFEYKAKYTDECDRSEEARVSRDRYKGLLKVAEGNVKGWTDACSTYTEGLNAAKARETQLRDKLEKAAELSEKLENLFGDC